MQTATFNSKVTEVENKIKATDIIAKSANTKANTITNASLRTQLNNLKSQYIATEVTSIDKKTKKYASDTLALENKLQQKEDTINENERELSFNRGFFYYLQQSYLVCECKVN